MRSFVVDNYDTAFDNELEELDNELVQGKLEYGKELPSYIPGQTK